MMGGETYDDQSYIAHPGAIVVLDGGYIKMLSNGTHPYFIKS